MSRKYVLHSGQRGSALAVRITPRASRNQIVGVLSDGTVKVHLASEPADEVLNVELVGYLAEVLGVPALKWWLAKMAGTSWSPFWIWMLRQRINASSRMLIN